MNKHTYFSPLHFLYPFLPNYTFWKERHSKSNEISSLLVSIYLFCLFVIYGGRKLNISYVRARIFGLFCSVPHPQCLEQCLAHSKCPVNFSWLSKYTHVCCARRYIYVISFSHCNNPGKQAGCRAQLCRWCGSGEALKSNTHPLLTHFQALRLHPGIVNPQGGIHLKLVHIFIPYSPHSMKVLHLSSLCKFYYFSFTHEKPSF